MTLSKNFQRFLIRGVSWGGEISVRIIRANMYKMGLNEDSVYSEVICFLVHSGAFKAINGQVTELVA